MGRYGISAFERIAAGRSYLWFSSSDNLAAILAGAAAAPELVVTDRDRTD
jgi:hypothetical protein